MKNRFFIITAILYFLLCVGNNLIHPITTPFLQNFLQVDDVYFGIYYSLMSFGLSIGAILCARLSKKIPYKLLIMIGLFGYALFQLLFGFVGIDPNLIIVWRFFSGLFVALPNTLFLVIAVEKLEPESRVKGLMLMTALNILGVAVGYEIGGLMYDYVFQNFHASFILQGAWCVSCGILSFILLDNNKGKEKNNNKKDGFIFKKLKPYHYIFFIVLFLFSTASVTINKFFEPFFQTIENQKFTSSDLAHFTLLTSASGMIANLVLIPFLKNNKKIKYDVVLTILFIVSSLLIGITFSFSGSILLIMLFTLYLIYTIIRNIVPPLEQNVIVDGVNNEDVSSVLSIRQSILSFGQDIGPLIFTNVFAINMNLTFYLGSILYFLAFILMIIYLKIRKNR